MTARRLAREAELELAAEMAQKLFIQGEELARRHHGEIKKLAAIQTAQTQKLSPEGQQQVRDMLKAQTAAAQGAVPKRSGTAPAVSTGASSTTQQTPQTAGSSDKPIFKKLDE